MASSEKVFHVKHFLILSFFRLGLKKGVGGMVENVL